MLLDSTILLWLVVGTATFFVLRALIFRLFLSSGIPGPRLAKLSGLWYAYRIYRGRFERENIDLHEQYGKIVRVAPNHYSINDPGALKTIYGHGTKFVKSNWYKGWAAPSFENLFSLRDPKEHAAERKIVANLYAMSSVVSYEPSVNRCIAVFCSQIDVLCRGGQAFNMQHWLQCYAFDVIGEITYSRRFGFLDGGHDIDGMMASLAILISRSTFAGQFPWAIPLIFSLPGGVSRMLDCIFAHINERQQQIQDDETGKIGDEPLALDFLEKMHKITANMPLSEKRRITQATTSNNVIAGSDTTSIALSSIFFHILRNPGVYNKLRSELDEALASGAISDPITFKQGQELPYLQAVLKEGLRLHSSTGLPLWRVVPAGGAEIAGHQFPPGAVVGINTWVIHHNMEIFGPDPKAFRPERWLDKPKEELSRMESCFLPFGVGSRTCIGKNISLLEMGKLVPTLVRKYDMEIVSYHGDGTMDSVNRWFVKPVGFNVRIKRRN
ncbi:putative cytochrome P450 oxidoreductase [Ilyonectria destructans]|nr:putative cytochrome P450 oxidoreductase [Ilyonectria destructans]